MIGFIPLWRMMFIKTIASDTRKSTPKAMVSASKSFGIKTCWLMHKRRQAIEDIKTRSARPLACCLMLIFIHRNNNTINRQTFFKCAFRFPRRCSGVFTYSYWLIQFELPDSARNHRPFWANTTTHSIALSWLSIGYETVSVNMDKQIVVFEKTE